MATQAVYIPFDQLLHNTGPKWVNKFPVAIMGPYGSINAHLGAYWALMEPFKEHMGAQFAPKAAIGGLYVVHT